MSTVNLYTMGGFGNRLFQLCAALSYCEKHGHTLHCNDTLLPKIFELDLPKIEKDQPRHNEDTACGQGDITLYGYFQQQKWLDLYSKAKVKKWLKWRHEIVTKLLAPAPFDTNVIACHLRRGDYLSCGYPVVSRKSYEDFLATRSPHNLPVVWVSDDAPTPAPYLPKELSFLRDFFQMMLAQVLLRANSSFSWWAHALAPDGQLVYSPRIDGLRGGMEHDWVQFEEGNHCRLADLPFITDLHLKP